MYNIRYHIASLVGVFLALSIGLLLGTIVAERGTLDDQRDALINSLERDFADLSAENKQLSAQNELRDDFVNDLVPGMVHGLLSGKTVIILAHSGRSDGLGAAQEAVRAAGGIPVTLTMEEPEFGVGTPEVDALTGSLLATPTTNPTRDVAAALAAEWYTPLSERPLTDALSDAGTLRASQLASGAKADAIVVIASWDTGPDTAAIEVGRAFADASLPAVGAQAVSLDTGVAAAALDRGLSGVDQLGLPEAMYSLDWLLAGRASGYYGVGTGASAPYPQP